MIPHLARPGFFKEIVEKKSKIFRVERKDLFRI